YRSLCRRSCSNPAQGLHRGFAFQLTQDIDRGLANSIDAVLLARIGLYHQRTLQLGIADARTLKDPFRNRSADCTYFPPGTTTYRRYAVAGASHQQGLAAFRGINLCDDRQLDASTGRQISDGITCKTRF